MRKLLKICGIPNATFVMTGQNSLKLPAGSKYAIVFLRSSKQDYKKMILVEEGQS